MESNAIQRIEDPPQMKPFSFPYDKQLLSLFIRLISNQNEIQATGTIDLCLLQPFGNMGETFLVGDIIADDGSNGITIIAPCDSFKAFLTCLRNKEKGYGVPDLQLDVIGMQIDGFGSEFDSNSNLMLISISFVGVLKQNARFADTQPLSFRCTRIANDDVFEQEGIRHFQNLYLFVNIKTFDNVLSILLLSYPTSISMDQKYVLYSYFRSSTSWRVRIALHLKNIPFEYRAIHLVKGQQKDQQYKKINPNAGVPALVLSTGQVLIQSAAIIEYLEEVHPEVPLFPKDPIKKAQIRGFCEVINSGLHPYQNLRALEKIKNDFDGDKIKWARDWIVRGMQTIEEMLKKSKGKYCFGDEITAADLFFVPHVQGGSARFKVSLDDYPLIKEVLGNLQQNEAFIKGSPKNQPDFEE